MLTRNFPRLLPALLICQACAMTPSPPLSGTDHQQNSVAQPVAHTAQPRVAVPATSALRAYKDPVTGEFTAPPPEVKVPKAPAIANETISTTPLPAMQETAVEGGGMKIDLQGRFRNYMSATKDTNGKITTHCTERADAEQHSGEASE